SNFCLEMTNNAKKEQQVLCDYCQIEKDGNQIYTTRKQFAGLRIVDILQTITQLSIPISTPIKLCSMCASTLHAATGAIEKTKKLIAKLAPSAAAKKQQAASEKKMAAEEEAADKTEAATAAANATPHNEPASVATPKKPQPQPQPSPKKSQSSAKKQAAPQQNGVATPVAAETQKSTAHANLDDSLNDVVKLTPSLNVSKKHKEVHQLFGTSMNHISDSESEEDDHDDVVDVDAVDSKDIPTDFDCRLCDFRSNYATKLKKHLRDEHAQKRPRVFHCAHCPKSFGVLKTLKKHLATHTGIKEKKAQKTPVEDKENKNENPPNGEENVVGAKTQNPQLAKFMPLQGKANQKAPENVSSSEYTFAIAASNSSTPAKPTEESKLPRKKGEIFECDICNLEICTAKATKAHFINEHKIERPKIFKCGICKDSFMHKSTKDRHQRDKHFLNGDGQPKAQIKLPARRKTVDVRPKELEAAAAKKSDVFPPKTPLRRKTVDVRPKALEESPAKLSGNKSIKEELPTPFKNVSKADSLLIEDTTEDEDDFPSSHNNSKLRENGDGKTPVKTPAKKSKAAKASDELDTSQLTASGSPKKASKRKSATAAEDDVGEQPLQQEQQQVPEVIDLLEVNPNVKPNKRVRLESVETSESQLSCGECNKVVGSRKRLDSHIRKKHNKSLNCPKCGVQYPGTLEYIGHFAKCNAGQGLPCGIQSCDKVFEGANYLSSHLKKKH
ncbi:hypothetical protein KR222_007208, partial [Zaprionus bogoriensis]